jgi:plasmid stabilization system protein ParE
MPQNRWSAKRERQYEHIKEGVRKRGESEETAEEIAARTVNKERAQHGEAKHASRATLNDTPAPVRGGHHSHQGPQGRTREQLYEDAKRKGIKGRSTMTKAELQKAVGR